MVPREKVRPLQALLANLKSTSSSVVYQALVEVRTKVIKSSEGTRAFIESGGVKYLIRLLQKPNEKIFDVTLSILGNCCLDGEARVQFRRWKGIPPLILILKNITKDSIVNRVCRLMGNLCKESQVVDLLHNENAVPALVSVIRVSGSSTETKQMAVRALRMMSDTASHREAIVAEDGVRAVSELLGTEDNDALLQAVVKAIGRFTIKCSEGCAQQVQGDGKGFECLVSHITNPLVREEALTSVINLSQVSSARPTLGNAGAVNVFILELQAPDSKQDFDRVVTALCLFCRESVNRMKIREAGGLQNLLNILKDEEKQTVHDRVMNALMNFLFDELSLKMLLDEGLVTVLVKHLKLHVKKNGKCHLFSKMSTERSGVIESRTSSFDSEGYGTLCEMETECNVKTNSDADFFSAEGDTKGAPSRCRRLSVKTFRVNSPSYQAVQSEYGEGLQWSGALSYREDWSPGSPSSLYFSPGSSPSSHGVRMSPQGSTGWSWESSVGTWSPVSAGFSSPNSNFSEPMDESGQYSPVYEDDDDDDDDEELVSICASSQLFSSQGESTNVSSEEDVIMSRTSEPARCELATGKRSSSVLSPPLGDDTVSTPKKTRYMSEGEDVHIGFADEESFEMHSPPRDPECPPVEGDKTENLKVRWLLILLSRVSHMDFSVDELVASDSIQALLDYLVLIVNPENRAGRVLTRIARNTHYFVPLVLQRFILHVFNRLNFSIHEGCRKCRSLNSLGEAILSQLTILAESGFGEGNLAYNLLKGDIDTRKTVALSVPFVIRTRKLLKKLLVSCSGLKIIFGVLQTGNSEEFSYAVLGLSKLALSVGVKTIAGKVGASVKQTPNISYCNWKELQHDVQFLLDDGSTISGNRDVLSKKSPVFDVMLNGSFRESKQSIVRVQETSFSCMVYLMHFLCECNCSITRNVSLDTALEVISESNKFLLPSLHERMCEDVVKHHIKPSTVSEICAWCISTPQQETSSFQSLCLETVKYLLVGEIRPQDRVHIFRSLMECGCRVQVHEWIDRLIFEQLSIYCYGYVVERSVF